MPNRSFNPRTGEPFGPEVADTDDHALEAVIAAANAASPRWAAASRSRRSSALNGIADRIDDVTEDLVDIADRETGLGLTRLRGEVDRTTFQLRMFASLLNDPGYLSTHYEEAADAAAPAGHPSLLRVLMPLGPVAVFAASNFPFAFSVAGGDTAAALAAGCPVVVKVHPAHPQLSEAVAEAVSSALTQSDAPAGTFAIVHGLDAGRALVVDPRIRAAAFTGSYQAGRALFELASSRPDPIPFYGEFGSVNPVFVTPGAARRGRALASDYLDSLLLGAGQFCTKPGLLIIPRGELLPMITASAIVRQPGTFLHPGISQAFHEQWSKLTTLSSSRRIVATETGNGPALNAPLMILSVDASAALHQMETLQTECFGPAGIIVEYDDLDQVVALAEALGGSLTATVHGDPNESVARALIDTLARRAGRVIWNGWPTGVAVARAQHHGGPHPATTNGMYTSVGAAAAERFMRPVVFQSLPPELLPDATIYP